MTDATEIVEDKDDGPKLGIFDDIPNALYHRGPGISKSGLDLIARSPLHFITAKRNPKPPTPAMIIGSAFHSLVLEPEKFADEFVMEPVGAPKRPTAAQLAAEKPTPAALKSINFWKAWDAENAGKMVITNRTGDNEFWSPGDWDRIHYMRDAVFADPIASIFLNPDDGVAEQTIYWIDPETKKYCKCRPDFINHAHGNLIVDLKSTNDASLTGFGKSAANFRYHVQDQFYRDGAYQAGLTITGFMFVAVEKEPPYAVACYVLDDEGKHVGRIQYKNNLYTYAQCMERDYWPGYPGQQSIFEPTVRGLDLPPWGLRGNIS